MQRCDRTCTSGGASLLVQRAPSAADRLWVTHKWPWMSPSAQAARVVAERSALASGLLEGDCGYAAVTQRLALKSLPPVARPRGSAWALPDDPSSWRSLELVMD
jgi:hypothetical protein